jgi:hypothetical protein
MSHVWILPVKLTCKKKTSVSVNLTDHWTSARGEIVSCLALRSCKILLCGCAFQATYKALFALVWCLLKNWKPRTLKINPKLLNGGIYFHYFNTLFWAFLFHKSTVKEFNLSWQQDKFDVWIWGGKKLNELAFLLGLALGKNSHKQVGSSFICKCLRSTHHWFHSLKYRSDVRSHAPQRSQRAQSTETSKHSESFLPHTAPHSHAIFFRIGHTEAIVNVFPVCASFCTFARKKPHIRSAVEGGIGSSVIISDNRAITRWWIYHRATPDHFQTKLNHCCVTSWENH